MTWLLAMCSLAVFFLWNPLWACGVMTVCAVAANVPGGTGTFIQRSGCFGAVFTIRIEE